MEGDDGEFIGMFDPPDCNCMSRPVDWKPGDTGCVAVIRKTHRNTFRYWCKKSGRSWTVEGSPMDVYNELVDPYIEEDD